MASNRKGGLRSLKSILMGTHLRIESALNCLLNINLILSILIILRTQYYIFEGATFALLFTLNIVDVSVTLVLSTFTYLYSGCPLPS
jgi:hypothetical protein